MPIRIALEQPWEAVVHGLSARPGFAWLDGGAQTHPWEGRWSHCASDPIDEVAVTESDSFAWATRLDGAAFERAIDAPRWIGFIAYEHAFGAFHPRASRHRRAASALAAHWYAYDAVATWDHRERRGYVTADDEPSARRLIERSAKTARPAPPRIGDLVATSRDSHRAAIEAAIEHIFDGDIYQVNLARRWSAPIDGDAAGLFEAMRRASPVPLGAMLRTPHATVLSRSMERFLKWDRNARTLCTRPIKGTVARASDGSSAARLRADPKETAEHSMIVDLMRNDLARVAELGTVRVERALDVEPYAALEHMVSTVACTTLPTTDLQEVLTTTFPPGSVTGTPKRRAVEIIDALEPCSRGVYTGAIGFISRGGSLSLAVAIRTAVASEGAVTYFAGGGIVEASDPERELDETELKARVFVDSLAALRR